MCLSLALPQRLKTGAPSPCPRTTCLAQPLRSQSSTRGAHARNKPEASRSSADGTSRSRTRGLSPKTTHGTQLRRRNQQIRGDHGANHRSKNPGANHRPIPGLRKQRLTRGAMIGASKRKMSGLDLKRILGLSSRKTGGLCRSAIFG